MYFTEPRVSLSHILDLRKLHPYLVSNMTAGPDFVIFNVGTWWSSKAIGHVIDEHGKMWSIDAKSENDEWYIVNKTSTTDPGPNVNFRKLMRKAIEMMLKIKHPRTTLVWRSEGTTDCPPGGSYRSAVARALHNTEIPILNISEATCNYLEARHNIDKELKGPHLCFPSVALRHWLIEFQEQFLG